MEDRSSDGEQFSSRSSVHRTIPRHHELHLQLYYDIYHRYLLYRIPLSPFWKLVENSHQWKDDNVAKPVEDSIQQHLLVFWMATFAYIAAFPVKGTAYVDRTMSWSDWITFLSTCFEKC